MRIVTTAFIVLALVTALAACSQGEQLGLRIEGRVTVQDGAGTPVAVSLGSVDRDAVDAGAAGADRHSFIAFDGGFLAATTHLDSDGAFSLSLNADLTPPSAALVDADAFVVGLEGCTVTASDAGARVTPTTWEGVFSPGVFVHTVERGVRPSLVSTTALDPDHEPVDLDGGRFPVWVYADRAVSLQTNGTCDATATDVFDVDVDLDAGWTRLAYDVSLATVVQGVGETTVTTYTLRNDPSSAGVFVLGFGVLD